MHEDNTLDLANELKSERECRKDIVRLTKILCIVIAIIFIGLFTCIYGVVHVYFYSSNDYSITNTSNSNANINHEKRE